jgi:hypothetical protein
MQRGRQKTILFLLHLLGAAAVFLACDGKLASPDVNALAMVA